MGHELEQFWQSMLQARGLLRWVSGDGRASRVADDRGSLGGDDETRSGGAASSSGLDLLAVIHTDEADGAEAAVGYESSCGWAELDAELCGAGHEVGDRDTLEGRSVRGADLRAEPTIRIEAATNVARVLPSTDLAVAAFVFTDPSRR